MKTNRIVLYSVIVTQIITFVILIFSSSLNRLPIAVIICLIILGLLLDLIIFKGFEIQDEVALKEGRIKETAITHKEMSRYRVQTSDKLITLQQLQDLYITSLISLKNNLYREDVKLDSEIQAASVALRDPYSEKYTDNTLINTILILKKQTAIKAGIDIKYSVSLPKEIPVKELDICTILCNQLDNAIEAASDCDIPGAFIVFQMCVRESYIFITTKNSIPKSIEKKVDFSTTSKSSPDEHGFGMSLIKSIAHKYKGHVSYEQSCDNTVQVIVALSLIQS